MDVIAPLIDTISVLCNLIAAKIIDVVNVDERVQSLRTALQELKNKREDLKRQVDRAELEGSTCTSQVKGWLERVEAVETEATSTMEVLGQRRKCFGYCNLTGSCTSKLSKKVAKLTTEVDELNGKADFQVVAANGMPLTVQEIPCRPAIGLNMMLERVWQCIAADEVGSIGIYGMGGVGKTTLLKILNNEFLTRSHLYDTVIWVVVSKDVVADKIQETIAARLGLSWEEPESHEQRSLKIYRVMKRRKFILLLDDVWEGIDLQKIGIPVPDKENKCKVIFTTRSLDVCSDMDAHQKLKLGFLGEEDSWQLFCDKVGGTKILESRPIRRHAEIIVRKCGGLPLALITIGKAMANKKTKEEWEYAVKELDRSPSEIRGMEDVFTLLKFSYDRLESDTLRSCFLYCSLFPEDYSIEKEQLIEYWLGEGLLGSSTYTYVYYKGYALIGSLKVACLLESGEEETQVKMHDVLRSFALWVASECGSNKSLCLVEAGKGLTESPGAEKWKEALRISLLDNGITTLTEIPECSNLSTLLLQWNNGLNKISNGFFQFMPALRVLDLSFTSLKEIPASIGKLVELRHLDLSGTKIADLPEELGDLAELEHLDLQRTHFLARIPQQAISRLVKLRVMNLYYSYEVWEDHNCEGENQFGFGDLECLKNLTTLGITVNELKTLKRLFYNFSCLLKLIQYLYIKECDGLECLQLSSSSNFGERLRRLSINNCYDFEYLQVDEEVGSNWLCSLEVLSLHGLPNLATVWRNPVSRECLQNLRCVNIWYCLKLKNVSWVLQLPNLEVMYLMYCKEMDEVVSKDVTPVGEADAFPSLRKLSIRNLPNLRSITEWELAFPSLESIAVIDCPKLKKLPIKTRACNSVPLMVYGEQEWWDGLEWDGAITESASLLHFMSM